MRRASVLLLFALLAGACASAEAKTQGSKKKPSAAAAKEGSEPGQRIPAFEAEGITNQADGTSRTAKLSSRRLSRPTAYVFLGTQCFTTKKYLGRLAALESAYAGKIDFVHLYPNKTDSSADKLAFHKQNGFKGPLVDDQGGRIARLLGGQRTAELVLASKTGVIVYRGAIDDSADEAAVKVKHFSVAADEHLAGKPISQPKTVGTA